MADIESEQKQGGSMGTSIASLIGQDTRTQSNNALFDAMKGDRPTVPQISTPIIPQQPQQQTDYQQQAAGFVNQNRDSIMVFVIFLILNSSTFKRIVKTNAPQFFSEVDYTMTGLLVVSVLAGVLFFLMKRFWRSE
tara:strand:- start:1166 stop:1573 length:408 start_codon:yes stop_codon:yes gene_type:complete